MEATAFVVPLAPQSMKLNVSIYGDVCIPLNCQAHSKIRKLINDDLLIIQTQTYTQTASSHSNTEITSDLYLLLGKYIKIDNKEKISRVSLTLCIDTMAKN